MTIFAENIFLCIAVPMVVSLFFTRGDVRRYVAAFFLGMGVCLVAAYVGGFLGMVANLEANDTSIFISPVVEEAMKFLTLLFFMVLFSPEDQVLTMLAVSIGTGFATFENSCHILTTGAGSLPYILIRGFSVGIMHVASMLALAIWLIVAKRLKAFTFSAVIGGLSLAMIFHALYNLLVSEPGITMQIGYLMPSLAAALLYFLHRKLPSLLED
ncbi:MAG: PrsW family intramembrane metalloprotease [Lachnospiraceae bacterium]|nr:PrsW family intramembrane metalloprotease [Lachnospiraceae bacterium]